MTFERLLALKLRCETDFRRYPFDVQRCSLKITSSSSSGPLFEIINEATNDGLFFFSDFGSKKDIEKKKSGKRKKRSPEPLNSKKVVNLVWGDVMKMSENQTSGSFEENMYIIEDSHEQKVNKIIGDMLQVKNNFIWILQDSHNLGLLKQQLDSDRINFL